MKAMWTVLYLPEAESERGQLPALEKVALINADRKLQSLGPQLPYPHSSAVKGADRLRELRPRGGRSPWRGLYRQVGDVFVVAAVAPEAQVDRRKFDAACRAAEHRLSQIEEESR
jgi:hypothetical protein